LDLPQSPQSPILFFGIPIPDPFAAVSRATRHELREIPSAVDWTIVVLAFGHALAALYHRYGS
jgi:cytochrome b561